MIRKSPHAPPYGKRLARESLAVGANEAAWAEQFSIFAPCGISKIV